MNGAFRLLLVLCFCFVAVSPAVHAQESATLKATATVMTTLTINAMNNLQFGSVSPGVNKSVDKTDVGFAGEWSIIGAPSAEIAVNFSLPTEMVTADSLSSMTMSFNSTDASYEDGTGGGQTAPAGLINPIWPSSRNIGLGGTLSVWIGGTVEPTISQTGGDYSADVILTIAYTGG